MNVHQNARLTVSCRVLMVERMFEWSMRRFRPLRTVRSVDYAPPSKWLRRYRDQGVKGLED